MELLLKEWIISLTAIAVLGAMVEITLPNSKFRIYTRFIFGLILLAILIKPVLPLLGGIQSLEDLIEVNFAKLETPALETDAGNFGDIQRQQVIYVYKSNLEKEIESRLKEELDIKTEAHVTIADNSESDISVYEPEIKRIDIIPKNEKVNIRPVKISVNSGKNNNTAAYEENDDKMESNIIKEIVNLLGINPDIIHIHSKD